MMVGVHAVDLRLVLSRLISSLSLRFNYFSFSAEKLRSFTKCANPSEP